VRVLTEPTAPGAAADQPAPGADRRLVALVLVCYLLAAVAVTWHLWADPAVRTVAGNPNDTDLFTWFLRYDAAGLTHGRLPALVTAAMNAPSGINLMWNTSVLLPGILLAPVTLLFGPQASLTVLVTAGFAGSAASMFVVLRRWDASISAAAIAGAVYGFSPALLQASAGHYALQLAILPPLLIDAGLRLCLRSESPVRDGVRLGLLAAAQLCTAEELLLSTSMAALLLVAVLAAAAPRAALRRCRTAAAGIAVAACVLLLLTGAALWVQFHGPLAQHGSAFTPDFFKNDLTGFVTPSGYLLFHTAASAAAAAAYQGGAPEYLGYLGWPLIAVLALGAIMFWRHPAVRATALATAVLELLSLGGHPLVSGVQQAITLPWSWLERLPVIGSALPDRLSVIADGTAAALLAFSLDQARIRIAAARARTAAARDALAADTDPMAAVRDPVAAAGSRMAPARPRVASVRGRVASVCGRVASVCGRVASVRGMPAVVTGIAVLAAVPLLPRPLPAATAAPLPAGWSAAFAALRLPADARVLVVPVPAATLTVALRWQADTGEPGSLNGGYFVGPAWNGQAYIDGNGVAVTAQYLDHLWSDGPQAAAAGQAAPVPAGPAPGPPSPAQLKADLAAWQPAAVVAVTAPGSALGRYLVTVFGPPSVRTGQILAWRGRG
jgi:hypothetical protein